MHLRSPEAFAAFQEFFSVEKPTTSAGKHSAISEIAIGSVLDHEVRHYHDSLISPYGAHAFRARIAAVLNGVQALRLAGDVEGTCVPAPLMRWVMMDEPGRAGQIQDWNACSPPTRGASWVPVSIPNRSLHDFAKLTPGTVRVTHLSEQEQFELFIDGAMRGYFELAVLSAGSRQYKDATGILPAMFFEVTALTTQIQSIFQGQGLIPAIQFVGFLFDSPLPYAKLWSSFLQLALLLEKQRRPDVGEEELIFVALPTLMTLAVWCLLGSYELEELHAAPAARFGALATYLLEQHTDSQNHSEDVASLWDHWDDKTSVVGWRAASASVLEYGKRGLERFTSARGKWEGDETVPALCESILRSYLQEQELMVRKLTQHPEDLVLPQVYANSVEDLPWPLLRITLDGFAIPIDDIALPVLKCVREYRKDGIRLSDDFVLSIEVAAGKKPRSYIDDVIEFEKIIIWCDVAMSDHSVPWGDLETAQRGVEGITRKRLFRIVE